MLSLLQSRGVGDMSRRCAGAPRAAAVAWYLTSDTVLNLR